MPITRSKVEPPAYWSVRWLWKGKIYRKRFHEQLGDAVDFHLKLQMKGRKTATLTCDNKGFPPPDKYLNHEYYVIEKRDVKLRGKYRKVKVRVKKTKNVMGDLNHKGWLWCPYCMKMRRFQKVSSEKALYIGEHHLECPLCDATTINWWVKRFNPIAQTIQYRGERRRVSSGKKKRSKRNRRRG